MVRPVLSEFLYQYLLMTQFNMTFLKKLLCAAAALVSINANAALITYDFNNGTDNSTSLQFSDFDDYTLEVTSIGGNINQSGRGLGVSGDPDSSRLGYQMTNGTMTNESLTFTLLDDTFDSVTIFFATSGGARFQGSDLAEISFGDMPSISFGQNESMNSITFNNVYKSSFTITSMGGNGFKVKSVQFQVPEPTNIALFGLALIGLAFSRRRTK